MRLLRAEEVTRRTGLSRSSIRRLEQEGRFPARRQITPQTIGWLESEVEDWIENRPVVEDRGAGASRPLANPIGQRSGLFDKPVPEDDDV